MGGRGASGNGGLKYEAQEKFRQLLKDMDNWEKELKDTPLNQIGDRGREAYANLKGGNQQQLDKLTQYAEGKGWKVEQGQLDNSLVNTDRGTGTIIGIAYVESTWLYAINFDSKPAYISEEKISLIESPKEIVETKFKIGEQAPNDEREYIAGILKTSDSEFLYYISNPFFEPETIQWIEL
jgi:hypothetical protein